MAVAQGKGRRGEHGQDCWVWYGGISARTGGLWQTLGVEQSKHKTRRSYNTPGHAHFLTYSCQHRVPLLSSDRVRRWVVESIEAVRREHDTAVWAYVVMPEHVHVLLRPRGLEYEVSRLLGALKRPVSARAKAWMTEHDPAWLERMTVRRGDRSVFRFWQAGGGFDRNVWEQRGIHEIVGYIHANPVRRGLVEKPTDWEWSSARFWAGMEGVVMKMDRVE